VNRVRVSLRFESGDAVAPNAALLSEGKEVGYVTRTGFSPAAGSTIGMGYLRREKATPGTELECGGVKASVIIVQ
jgi:glycine cleavage system aminomethyltransferase T